MIFFCQLCLKAFCLIQVIQIKLTPMVFVWYISLCPMVEFNLQNCISFKVVLSWDHDGIPETYCIQFLFIVCCFFPHNRYSHNCWLPLFCPTQVKLSKCCTSFEIRMSRSGWSCNAMEIVTDVTEVKAKSMSGSVSRFGKLIDMGHLSPLDSPRAKKGAICSCIEHPQICLRSLRRQDMTLTWRPRGSWCSRSWSVFLFRRGIA